MNKLLNSPFFNILVYNTSYAFVIFFLKIAFNNGVKPMAMYFWSNIFSIVCFIIFFILKGKKFKNNSLRVIKRIFVIYLLTIPISASLHNIGISMTSATNAGFLLRFSLVATFFFSYLILKERITREKIVAGAVIILGVFFISTKGKMTELCLGDLLIVLCATFGSLQAILVKRELNRDPEFDSDLIGVLKIFISFPVILSVAYLSPFFSESLGDVYSLEFNLSNDLIFFAIGGCLWFLFYVFNYRAIKGSQLSYVTMMNFIFPLEVAILGAVFLNEGFVFIQAAGAALVISAGFFVHYLKIGKEAEQFEEPSFSLLRRTFAFVRNKINFFLIFVLIFVGVLANFLLSY